MEQFIRRRESGVGEGVAENWGPVFPATARWKTSSETATDSLSDTAGLRVEQARSQDCNFGGEGSFSVWGQTYFEYYYTAIAC